MNYLSLLHNITTFVFDMDGVLTDATVLVLPDGVWARRMHVRDGYALQLAVKKGYNVVVISGSNSAEVKARLHKLGITDVYMSITDKQEVLRQYLSEKNINKAQVLVMGDDIPDIKILPMAGFACCPADAVQEIKEIAHYVSHIKGGEGCVRDVIEKTLKLQDNWNEDTSIPSK